VEIELFKALPETATNPKTQLKRISETDSRLSLNVSNQLLNTLNRLREIWSHVNPNMNYVEVIERCADETLRRVDPTRKPAVRESKAKKPSANFRESPQSPIGEAGASSAEGETIAQSKTRLVAHPVRRIRAKYFPVQVRSEIHEKAEGCCQYVDPKTERRRRSRFLLQTDHIVPIWAGGSNEPENLQLLCATHNRLKYKLETNRFSDQIVLYERCLLFRAI
jgi:5-methylcytosine-specific restriction endonuclease McrA